jgi:hypothetical protein
MKQKVKIWERSSLQTETRHSTMTRVSTHDCSLSLECRRENRRTEAMRMVEAHATATGSFCTNTVNIIINAAPSRSRNLVSCSGRTRSDPLKHTRENVRRARYYSFVVSAVLPHPVHLPCEYAYACHPLNTIVGQPQHPLYMIHLPYWADICSATRMASSPHEPRRGRLR